MQNIPWSLVSATNEVNYLSEACLPLLLRIPDLHGVFLSKLVPIQHVESDTSFEDVLELDEGAVLGSDVTHFFEAVVGLEELDQRLCARLGQFLDIQHVVRLGSLGFWVNLRYLACLSVLVSGSRSSCC